MANRTLQHAYKGTPHTRVLTAADFKAIGVEGQEKVEFSPKNQHTAELTEAAATWLLENEAGDWKEIEVRAAEGDDDSDEDSSSASGSGGDAGGTRSSGSASSTTTRKSRS